MILMNNSSSPAEQLLQLLGKQGKCVADFLNYCHNAGMREPQLVLHRKFEQVKIIKQPQVVEHETEPDTMLIACLASGFPYPTYQWYCNSTLLNGEVANVLSLRLERVSQEAVYYCIASNEITEDEVWSSFYYRNGKHCCSAVKTDQIRIRSSLPQRSTCEVITSFSLKDENFTGDPNGVKLKLAGDSFLTETNECVEKEEEEEEEEELIAVDKVALIISNSQYLHLGKLLTPTYDANVLAENLIQLGFKTVTLSDLTLEEMRGMLTEYCSLLSNGVYGYYCRAVISLTVELIERSIGPSLAALYFVGHGFEANGQSYLIPIDAAEKIESFNECLCAEEVLSMMQEKSPAMSVILLDICRRSDNFEVPVSDFVTYKSRVNRNTVVGYATSFGEGAYEVVGELNGVFMKYLKKYLQLRKPVAEILTLVMRDLENDAQAKTVQFPEVRTNMSKLRSLADPLIFDSHTATYDLHTYRWQQLHQLPEPMKIIFPLFHVFALIWFDFHGYFSNMVIVYTSVLSMPTENGERTTNAETEYVAMLMLPDGTMELQLQLRELKDGKVISVATVTLSDVLVSKLNDTA
ncbi:Mucosa associated lymphoid tissue lymphoma transl ocation protein 1, isoform b [Trichuris trichiura]|uniref:Mucosa associated lymphoid tissue lymphoma transl ocation protein 1, isoform b n=1 Tax=Trichuris trichiura TaxID=36087 RepID=A0A077ZDR7_TRITR|nr:Mucosa associated lymphoid tissue lymphoma transl ocation protein 1, isoform b [Trichuris trichiura]